MAQKKCKEIARTLTVKEAAGLLGVSEATLRRWDHLGRLPARRHPVNGYRLYERERVLALRGKMVGQNLIAIPADFPNFCGGLDVAIVDTLIVILLGDRDLLNDPLWRPQALARIERARSAIMPFGMAPRSVTVRIEMMVTALDKSAEFEAPLESRVRFAQVLIGEAMPGGAINDELVREAVRLWPDKRNTEARLRAVRDLARALKCDSPSLMTMLRAARKRLRDRKSSARRN